MAVFKQAEGRLERLWRWAPWVLTAAVAAGAFHLWPRPRFERLIDLPEGAQPMAVRQGRLFYRDDGLWTTPTHRHDRTLAAETPPPSASGGRIVTAESAVLTPVGGAPGRTTSQYLAVRYTEPKASPVKLDVPQDAGPLTFFRGDGYWLQPERKLRRRGAKATAIRSRLYAAPVEGGPRRLVATGITEPSRLEVSYHGLSCIYGPDNSRKRTAFLIRRDGTRDLLPSFDGQATPTPLGDKWYWLAERRGQNTKSWVLVSDGQDGSPVRRVTPLGEHEPIFRWLITYKGSLYYCSRGAANGTAHLVRLSAPNYFPVAITPDYSEPFSFVWVDQGYVYFVAREHREDWLKWSGEGMNRTVPVLHRYRLDG